MIGGSSSRNRRASSSSSSSSSGDSSTLAASVSGAAYGGYARKQVCAILSRLPQGCTKVTPNIQHISRNTSASDTAMNSLA
jgi:hypothetical protein